MYDVTSTNGHQKITTRYHWRRTSSPWKEENITTHHSTHKRNEEKKTRRERRKEADSDGVEVSNRSLGFCWIIQHFTTITFTDSAWVHGARTTSRKEPIERTVISRDREELAHDFVATHTSSNSALSRLRIKHTLSAGVRMIASLKHSRHSIRSAVWPAMSSKFASCLSTLLATCVATISGSDQKKTTKPQCMKRAKKCNARRKSTGFILTGAKREFRRWGFDEP